MNPGRLVFIKVCKEVEVNGRMKLVCWVDGGSEYWRGGVVGVCRFWVNFVSFWLLRWKASFMVPFCTPLNG